MPFAAAVCSLCLLACYCLANQVAIQMFVWQPEEVCISGLESTGGSPCA